MSSQEDKITEIESIVNYAKMLIRSGNVEDGLERLRIAETLVAESSEPLPPQILYLIPFTRGRAHMQLKQAGKARVYLEQALELASTDMEARARIHNLLGIIVLKEHHPELAVQLYGECVHAIKAVPIKDTSFRSSVFQNMANAYWAWDKPTLAIGAYNEVLRVLQDLNEPYRQADIYWGLALCYQALKNWPLSKMYAIRAVRSYELAGNRLAGAAMWINFAEILINTTQLPEAEQALEQASEILEQTDAYGLLSFLYRYRAELSRQHNKLVEAADFAKQGVHYAELLQEHGQMEESQVWIDPVRAYAEACYVLGIVQEALGNRDIADSLFNEALQQLATTTVVEAKRKIHNSYASVLEARGAFELAIEQYKAGLE